MQVKVTVGIDDQHWPKLSCVVYTHVDDQATSVSGPTKFTYDLAYTAIENMVHNSLRSVVNDVLKKHGK